MIIRSMDELTDFIAGNEKVLLQCKSRDCNVCSAVSERLKEDMDIYRDWAVAEVYVDEMPLFRGAHSVFTVPTVLMFYEQKEIYRTSRFINFDKMTYFVEMTQ